MKLSLRTNFHISWQDRAYRLALIANGLFLLLSILIILIAWQRLPPQLPLFYSLPWGEEQLGQKVYLLILPLCSFLITLPNSLLSIFLDKQKDLVIKILLWLAIGNNLLIFIALVKIIFLVI